MVCWHLPLQEPHFAAKSDSCCWHMSARRLPDLAVRQDQCLPDSGSCSSDQTATADQALVRLLLTDYTAPPAPVSVPAAMEMDDDFDSAFEHGKAVGWNACRAAMLQSQGNCIKDGWISCSDRMPEDTKMLLAFSQGEIVAAYWNWVVNPIDYKKYRAFTYLSGNILDDVTHWMPLPEPPL